MPMRIVHPDGTVVARSSSTRFTESTIDWENVVFKKAVVDGVEVEQEVYRTDDRSRAVRLMKRFDAEGVSARMARRAYV